MNQELRFRLVQAIAKHLHDDDAAAFGGMFSKWESLRPGDHNYDSYIIEAEKIVDVVRDVWTGQLC